MEVTDKMRQMAHNIHHEIIEIDHKERREKEIDWVEEYFKMLNLANDLADAVLGC